MSQMKCRKKRYCLVHEVTTLSKKIADILLGFKVERSWSGKSCRLPLVKEVIPIHYVSLSIKPKKSKVNAFTGCDVVSAFRGMFVQKTHLHLQS